MSAILDSALDDSRRESIAAFDRMAAAATPQPRPRPTHPPLLAAWLALEFRRGAMSQAALVAEAQAMAHELAALKGYGLLSDAGHYQSRLPLSDASAVVEWECEDDSDEPNIVAVHLNGQWCDPAVIREDIRDEWVQMIRSEARQ